jgi:hypothetical protein
MVIDNIKDTIIKKSFIHGKGLFAEKDIDILGGFKSLN